MWTNSWLNFIRIVQSYNMVKIRDIKSSDVISSGESEISVFSILCEIGAIDR